MEPLRLTYAAIAERLRISHDAARMLVRRRGWQRTLPNRRGAPAIVVIPEDELEAEQWRTDGEGTFSDVRGTPPVERLNEAEERAEQAERRADMAEQRAETADADRRASDRRADAALALADRLGAQLADERERAHCIAQQFAEATRNLTAAEGAASEARAALDAARQQAREAQTAAEAAQFAQLEAETSATLIRADLEAAHRLVETAQERADALAQADAARKGQGRWTRLRAAWRGE
jgi:hypothetical protein